MPPSHLLAPLALVLALVTGAPPLQDEAGTASIPERAKEVVQGVRTRNDLVGLAAAIGFEGELRWSGASGLADIENEVRAKPQMVHRIASISKPITAIAALQLVEEGRLDLDADVRLLVPEFPEKRWPITARHLLTHTSGIRHYQGLDSSTTRHYATLERALERFASDALLFEPGSKVQYSTYAYTLLGLAVERAAEMPLEELLDRRIWQPARMTSTRFERPGDIVRNRARGYVLVDGAARNAGYSDLSFKFPGGGMLSTAEDLARLGVALLAGELLQPETVGLMATPYTLADGTVTSRGLGWQVHPGKDGTKALSHTGGQRGATTSLRIDLQRRATAAAICNVEGAKGVTRLPFRLLGLLASPGAKPPEPGVDER